MAEISSLQYNKKRLWRTGLTLAIGVCLVPVCAIGGHWLCSHASPLLADILAWLLLLLPLIFLTFSILQAIRSLRAISSDASCTRLRGSALILLLVSIIVLVLFLAILV